MNLHDLPPGDGSLLLTTDDLKMSLLLFMVASVWF
jgi:hypothetical protein